METLNYQQKYQDKIHCSYPTYEEWKREASICEEEERRCVLILPMRNGNYVRIERCHTEQRVLILPMRNGNASPPPDSAANLRVLILPMRNGNMHSFLCHVHLLNVLILPMRNGNPFISLFNVSDPYRSYPTYEEWKRYYKSFHTCPLLVLILPMRNGNKQKAPELMLNDLFLSYL